MPATSTAAKDTLEPELRQALSDGSGASVGTHEGVAAEERGVIMRPSSASHTGADCISDDLSTHIPCVFQVGETPSEKHIRTRPTHHVSRMVFTPEPACSVWRNGLTCFWICRVRQDVLGHPHRRREMGDVSSPGWELQEPERQRGPTRGWSAQHLTYRALYNMSPLTFFT